MLSSLYRVVCLSVRKLIRIKLGSARNNERRAYRGTCYTRFDITPSSSVIKKYYRSIITSLKSSYLECLQPTSIFRFCRRSRDSSGKFPLSAPNLGGVDHVLCNFQSIPSLAFREESLPSSEKGSLMLSKSNVLRDPTATSQEIGIEIRGVLSLIQTEMHFLMPYEVDLTRRYRHIRSRLTAQRKV